MADQFDDKFYERADAHIHLSNEHLDGAPPSMVNASMIYATARFNAWLSASGFRSGEAMKAKRDETVEYFVAGYRQMLEANLDEYATNFDAYMKQKTGE